MLNRQEIHSWGKRQGNTYKTNCKCFHVLLMHVMIFSQCPLSSIPPPSLHDCVCESRAHAMRPLTKGRESPLQWIGEMQSTSSVGVALCANFSMAFAPLSPSRTPSRSFRRKYLPLGSTGFVCEYVGGGQEPCFILTSRRGTQTRFWKRQAEVPRLSQLKS